MPLKTIVVAVIIAAIVLVSGLILLGLAGDFLVDWAWFSAVGYLSVFWTILSTKTVIFFAVFVCSGAFLWLNGLLASRFSGRGKHASCSSSCPGMWRGLDSSPGSPASSGS